MASNFSNFSYYCYRLNGLRNSLGLKSLSETELRAYIKSRFENNVGRFVNVLFKEPQLMDRLLREEKAEILDPLIIQRRAEKKRRYKDRREARRITIALELGSKLQDKIESDKISINAKTSEKAGYIYIATNPAWPGWIKIGSTIRLVDRLTTLNTGDPFAQYQIEFFEYTNDRVTDEHSCHSILNEVRGQGEWFYAEVETASALIKKISRERKTSEPKNDYEGFLLD